MPVPKGRRGVAWCVALTPFPPAYPPACSAANVKKWEVELQTLRESNARLNSALQESAACAEQWKRQFSVCRDENDRLRSKVGGRDPWSCPEPAGDTIDPIVGVALAYPLLCGPQTGQSSPGAWHCLP